MVMNSTKRLANVYTQRFLQDNKPNIDPARERIAKTIEHPNGRETDYMNAEFISGPFQTWPAQVDDFFNKVLLGYEGDKIDYENVTRIMTENSPEISTRSYISEAECQWTLSKMLEATISAMSTGKKWQCIKDIGREEGEKQGFFERSFRKRSGLIKRLEENNTVQKIIGGHNEQFPEKRSTRRINISQDFKYIFA
jgi:hypothetical protein